MIYATRDNDGLKIDSSARVYAFETRAMAEAWLSGVRKLSDFKVEITEGEYGDCWFKTINAPSEVDCRPFSEGELIIQSPGQHPGGAFYWVTPRVPVLVAVVGEEEEE